MRIKGSFKNYSMLIIIFYIQFMNGVLSEEWLKSIIGFVVCIILIILILGFEFFLKYISINDDVIEVAYLTRRKSIKKIDVDKVFVSMNAIEITNKDDSTIIRIFKSNLSRSNWERIISYFEDKLVYKEKKKK